MLSSLLIPSSCFWNFSLYYGLKNAACYDRSLLHHECFTSHPLRMTRCEPSKSEAKWKTKTTPSSSFSSLWCLIAGSNQTIVLLIDGIFSWSHSVCDLLVLKAQDLLRILLEFYSSCYMTGSLTETAQLPQYHWDGNVMGWRLSHLPEQFSWLTWIFMTLPGRSLGLAHSFMASMKNLGQSNLTSVLPEAPFAFTRALSF